MWGHPNAYLIFHLPFKAMSVAPNSHGRMVTLWRESIPEGMTYSVGLLFYIHYMGLALSQPSDMLRVDTCLVLFTCVYVCVCVCVCVCKINVVVS